MKSLTLQITKINFDAILNGTQKKEERNIYPNTAKRYIVDPDTEGEIELVKYDQLYLINGRRKDARRLRVEVLEAVIYFETDEDGKDIVYEEDGIEYVMATMSYTLGKVIETENC